MRSKHILKYSSIILSTMIVVLVASCSNKPTDAQLKLTYARNLYTQGNYKMAILQIDSLNKLYPKAIAQRKASLILLDSVRYAYNNREMRLSDSILTAKQPLMSEMLKGFVFDKNKEWSEAGYYIPKGWNQNIGNLTASTLRAGVSEKGQLYIESVFIGKRMNHNKIKIVSSNGDSAETLEVTADGLNYNFSNLGKNFEIIRFVGKNENGVGKFIHSHSNIPLKVIFEGKNNTSVTLPSLAAKSISKAVQLSDLLSTIDSIKTAKDKARYRNYYLDKKNKKVQK